MVASADLVISCQLCNILCFEPNRQLRFRVIGDLIISHVKSMGNCTCSCTKIRIFMGVPTMPAGRPLVPLTTLKKFSKSIEPFSRGASFPFSRPKREINH